MTLLQQAAFSAMKLGLSRGAGTLPKGDDKNEQDARQKARCEKEVYSIKTEVLDTLDSVGRKVLMSALLRADDAAQAPQAQPVPDPSQVKHLGRFGKAAKGANPDK